MSISPPTSAHRISVTLRKPKLAAYGWVRPTVVLAGIGNPAQWGAGTWLVAAEAPVTLSVFVFNRLWRFGAASIRFEADQTDELEYVAPLLPFLRGRLRISGQSD